MFSTFAPLPPPLSSTQLPLSFSLSQCPPRSRYLHYSTMDQLEDSLNAQILAIRDHNRDVHTGKPLPPRARESPMEDTLDKAEEEDEEEEEEEEEEEDEDAADDSEGLDDDDADELPYEAVNEDDHAHALLSSATPSPHAVRAADARYAADGADGGGGAADEEANAGLTDEEYAMALQAEEDLYAAEDDAMNEVVEEEQ